MKAISAHRVHQAMAQVLRIQALAPALASISERDRWAKIEQRAKTHLDQMLAEETAAVTLLVICAMADLARKGRSHLC